MRQLLEIRLHEPLHPHSQVAKKTVKRHDEPMIENIVNVRISPKYPARISVGNMKTVDQHADMMQMRRFARKIVRYTVSSNIPL